MVLVTFSSLYSFRHQVFMVVYTVLHDIVRQEVLVTSVLFSCVWQPRRTLVERLYKSSLQKMTTVLY